ncbi:MAG TPA: glycosyltransferase family 39 protein [Polyangia bacterium]|nr:glycosyltransferase family 39 protein [Polyangia bacterium]
MARANYLLAAVFLIALAAFGRHYHWVEAANTAERDAFVDKADLIRQGELPRDPFRPPLYPLLAAGLAPLAGGTFGAARLISTLAACGLALAAFGFGRRLGDRRIALLAMGLTIANANLWIFGVEATTDMLFAALAAGALLAGLAYLQRPSAGAALAAGLAAALGAWVRGNAGLLAPALILAYLLAPKRATSTGADESGGRSAAHVALAVGAALLVLLPLWGLRWRDFGSPFHDENWRNLWWKLHAHGDWTLLEHGPPSSYRRLLLGEPGAVAASTLRELGKFFTSALPGLSGGWWGLPPLALAVGAAVRGRRRDELYLLAALLVFTLGVAAIFFTWGRFMLLWIPIAAALSIGACHRLAAKPAAAASGALVALTLAAAALSQLPAFVRQHPYGEVAALAPLDRQLAPGEALAGTAPFLKRYFQHRYLPLPDETGLAGVDGYGDWCGLERLLRGARVRYLAVSDVELRQRPRSLLGQGDPPPWLQLVRKDAHAALWRVRDGAASAGAPCP